jgi:hypothetical protein
MPEYIRLQTAAARLGVSDRSVMSYADRGKFKVYKKPGHRAYFVEWSEVKSALSGLPRTEARTALNEHSPKARVVLLSEEAVVEQ